MKPRILLLMLGMIALPNSFAQWVYEPLFQYQRPGGIPQAPLVAHSDGQIYGTAVAGGTLGGGSVFRVANGAVSTVASLGGTLGSAPLAGLVSAADGTLVGTCSSGGNGNFGTVFQVTTAGVVTKLRDFTGTSGATAGSVPGDLVRHPDGNYYGTARAGGSSGHGVVFRLTPGGVYTVMAQFTGTGGSRPGSQPIGRLAISGTNLYGVTRFGGSGNFGTAFRISTSDGFAFASIFSFTGNGGSFSGEQPAAGLTLHSNGILYGTTERGGVNGFGKAFSLSLTNSYTPLHDFADATASQPVGSLIEGTDGNLYGAAAAGGTAGFGGVFRLSTSGVHELLTTFLGSNGATPQAGPLRLASGEMVGTTSTGGPGQLGLIYRVNTMGSVSTDAVLSPAHGWHPSGAPVALPNDQWAFPVAFGGESGGGTLGLWQESAPSIVLPVALPGPIGQQTDGGLVAYDGSWWGVTSSGSNFNRGATFSYDPATGFVLRNAHNLAAGSRAEGPLTKGADGLLYGLARESGAEDRGTLFQINSTGARTAMLAFTGTSNDFPGRSPRGPLVLASNGALYGVTELGGSNNLGVIFKYVPPSTYQILAEFEESGPNTPRGGLIAAPDGFLYGTTTRGGTNDTGAILRINPSTDAWTSLSSFPANNGGPEGELVRATDGAILGFTTTGSSHGGVFRFQPSNNTLSFPVSFSGGTGAAPGAALSPNSTGIKFTGGLRELSPDRWFGVASGGGAGNGGVVFRLTNTSGSPRNAWLTTELQGMDASGNGDPDFDGILNNVEYALGLDPAIRNSNALPSPSVINGHLQITVPRFPARNDITYIIEGSTTLDGTWSPVATSTAGSPFSGPGYLTGETSGSSTKSVTIRLPEPVSTNPRGFLRLKIED